MARPRADLLSCCSAVLGEQTFATVGATSCSFIASGTTVGRFPLFLSSARPFYHRSRFIVSQTRESHQLRALWHHQAPCSTKPLFHRAAKPSDQEQTRSRSSAQPAVHERPPDKRVDETRQRKTQYDPKVAPPSLNIPRHPSWVLMMIIPWTLMAMRR